MVSEELEGNPGWPFKEVEYQCVFYCMASGISETLEILFFPLEILKHYLPLWPEISTSGNMPIELKHHV